MRPHLHLTADGWVNDPLALTWHDGRYHLFMQYVPDSLEWAVSCHWGHATSTDLLHWRAEPVAVAPGDGDDGVWSGCVVDADPPVMLYTAVSADAPDQGRVRVATPQDTSWQTWLKGPVVITPPPFPLAAFRDPFVLRDGESWRMVVGAGLPDARGALVGYRSQDLTSWTLDGILAERVDEPGGTVWECPQLVQVDGHWVLVVSVWEAGVLDHLAWAVGDLGERFEPRRWGRLTWGTCYAGSAFRDAEGRPGMISWLREVRGDDWTGALSVPVALHVVDGAVVARPHPAVDAAVGEPVAEGVELVVDRPSDLRWAARPGDRLELGDAVLVAGGQGTLTLTSTAGSWDLPWAGEQVRVLVDAPVVEVVTATGFAGAPAGVVRTVRSSGAEVVLRPWG